MPKSRPVEVTLTPVDNHQLANLCGPLDENIRQIETGFDVTIQRRNERFSVRGEKARLTADVIRHFYAMARAPLSVDEIQLGLIEFLNAPVRRIARSPDSPIDGPQLLTRKADLHGRTPRQVAYLKAIQEHDITFGIGPAGTGKTYLAVAAAVDALQRSAVQRIVLTRPAVEAGERLGFLPGDLNQKVDPYLRPLYDALYDLMGYDQVHKAFERQQLEIAPLGFMRGRTLNNAFVILDEAQNTTPEQMKMFLTRIGFGAKAVITGDVSQIDLPKTQLSGLVDAERVLRRVSGIAITHLTSADIVRHPLVARVVDAYDAARLTELPAIAIPEEEPELPRVGLPKTRTPGRRIAKP